MLLRLLNEQNRVETMSISSSVCDFRRLSASLLSFSEGGLCLVSDLHNQLPTEKNALSVHRMSGVSSYTVLHTHRKPKKNKNSLFVTLCSKVIVTKILTQFLAFCVC